MTDRTDADDADPDDEHLRELPDGLGCTEIWERLSETRADQDGSDRD